MRSSFRRLAPDVSYAHLQWGRVQVNVGPEELGRVQIFLASLVALTTATIIGIQSRADGIPRILNPQPGGSANPDQPADQARLLLATDLDVVSRSGVRNSDGSARTWRLVAICADWRVGIEGRLLACLDPDLALVGLTAAILYGQSVLLLLCHRAPGQAIGDNPRLRGVVFDRWLSRNELGTATPQPLLRVHLRTPDRPGATVAVLDSLRAAPSSANSLMSSARVTGMSGTPGPSSRMEIPPTCSSPSCCRSITAAKAPRSNRGGPANSRESSVVP